ncbi:hypothetical protein COL91_12940 [Bacillus pseudomycoides]|nr:hypothetical protein COO02_21185 [Bacillus pseudomycoides]PEI92736.1 hypothetical protein CN679_09985 [Bacillus pseudomycoides]PGA90777.1 hypothetical protein COL91_12940 [Bacillus pseudomycoides]PHF50711.1 hypothetical protein COF72_03820 [Bacillus pseudomycoides]
MHFNFSIYKLQLRITKGDRYLFSLFVFTWHGAGKESDRFYAWRDALSHLKRRILFRFFNLYLYSSVQLFFLIKML